jgi:uncharacterized membrane protein YgdD (TMEM256/DUF423 family)
MERGFFAAGSISGLLGVLCGAFGAHALRGHLSSDALAVYETGVRYQLFHAMGLFAASWAAVRWPGRAVRTAGWLFIVGTLLFSGSLYALAMTGQRTLGAITPFGGVCWAIAWICLLIASSRRNG